MSEEANIILITLLLSIGPIITLLHIILFFKIWRMTNDVRDIRDTLDEWLEKEHPRIR